MIQIVTRLFNTVRGEKKGFCCLITKVTVIMNSKLINSTILITFLISAIVLCSCDQCRNLDCVSSNYTGLFKIISKSTGEDLLLEKVYDKDKIKIYSIDGSDTTRLPTMITVNEEARRAGITCYFAPGTKDKYYIEYGNGDTDTLTLTLKTNNSECCGVITTVGNIELNDVKLKREQGIYLIEK